MKIVFAASEATPFIKTGGLGEVVGALSMALARAGHDVRVVVPRYRGLSSSAPAGAGVGAVRIPLGVAEVNVQIHEVVLSPRCRAWLVDSPVHFDRDGVYVDSMGREYGDNDARFILLSRAALEFPKAMGFRPDIIHAHDWQTGLVPTYLHLASRHDPFFAKTASVFSIHNIAYQGVFPKETMACARLPWTEFTAEKIEFYDRINFLKAGLAYAQVLSTVSPTYAHETQRDEFGVGLDGFLKRRADHYFGILNGIDLRLWNPAQDPHLAHPFSVKSLKGRVACRADLQRTAGLQEDPRAPLLGMVSRLDAQKGFDILLDILDDFFRDGCQAVFLGQGNPVFQGALRTLQRKFPGRVSFSSDFNEPLAHKIYGGSDLFLMPSRFEPCGLGQMIALRYGTVPVVTPTGGLKDTVLPVSPDGREGVGFVADRTETWAYRSALERAVKLYRSDSDLWRALQHRGMAMSFDWKESVRRYVELYRLAQSKKRVEGFSAKGRGH